MCIVSAGHPYVGRHSAWMCLITPFDQEPADPGSRVNLGLTSIGLLGLLA